MSLIEVVGGLALMATLLVALLAAKSGYTRQWVQADRRLEALAAAERLLAEWWGDVKRLPREATGEIAGAADLRWRTQVVSNGDVEELGGEVVRLEILNGRALAAGEVVAAVEIVVSRERRRDERIYDR